MGKQWLTAFLLFGSIVIVIVWTATHESEARSVTTDVTEEPLQVIQHIDKKTDELNIRNQRIHIYGRTHNKDFSSKDEMDRHIQEWMHMNGNFKWEMDEDANHESWKGYSANDSSSPYQEKVTIHVFSDDTNHQYETYAIYEASFIPMPDWETAFSSLFNTNQSILSLIDPSDIFLRIEGKVAGDDHDVYETGQHIVEAFQADLVEELHEDSFVSLSAYTPLWGKSIETNGESMNLQVALRTQKTRLGGETTVTIGTPIITTEY
ncbi:YwmB family TATA-box binding protein [Evansella halocellulosilytica]|uniref:YwmB family TATA-box binding protein n=1 Tax=Evansella halocellulosilytica TaxID=2011013 RepID=UPI000BB94A94|nr:YwmB family TATA-box binding protein [Evansella halocellulosilytica]